MLDLHDHVALAEVRVAQHLAGVQAGPTGHAGTSQDLHDVVLRPRRRPRLDQRIDLFLVLPAGVRRLVARVADEIVTPDGAQQRVPHLLLDEDEDVVVGPAGAAPIRRPRHAGAELVAGAQHGLAEPLMVPQADADEVDDRVLHRHLDLLPLAGGVALHERGEDTDHAVHAGPGVADRRPHVHRWAVRDAGDAHGAPHGLRDGLVALVVAIRPVGAEALDAREHEAGVDLAERGIAEAQPLDDAGTEVLQQHVGRLQQGAEDVLAARVLQIDRQAPLVRVERQVEKAIGVGTVLQRVSRRVALARLLDLDDVRTQPGQHLAAGRPRLVVGEIDDPDARQRLTHRSVPSRRGFYDDAVQSRSMLKRLFAFVYGDIPASFPSDFSLAEFRCSPPRAQEAQRLLRVVPGSRRRTRD